jgi:hypothetical protein
MRAFPALAPTRKAARACANLRVALNPIGSFSIGVRATLKPIEYKRLGRHRPALAYVLPNGPADIPAWLEARLGPIDYVRDQDGQVVDSVSKNSADIRPDVREADPTAKVGVAEEAGALSPQPLAEVGHQPEKKRHSAEKKRHPARTRKSARTCWPSSPLACQIARSPSAQTCTTKWSRPHAGP